MGSPPHRLEIPRGVAANRRRFPVGADRLTPALSVTASAAATETDLSATQPPYQANVIAIAAPPAARQARPSRRLSGRSLLTRAAVAPLPAVVALALPPPPGPSHPRDCMSFAVGPRTEERQGVRH